MKWHSVRCGSVVALLGLGLAIPASAAPISGHLNLAGGIVYDTRGTAGLAVLDFTPLGGGTGTVVNIAGATGYFSPLDTFSFATILDITNDSTAAPATLVIAGTDYGPGGIGGFLSTFTDPDIPGLHFDLTKLLVQGFTCTGSESGVGASCLAGPFALQQTANGLLVNFDVQGFFRKGAAGCVGITCTDEGLYQGSFGATFGGLSFATLFNRLDNTGQDIMCGTNNLETACSFDANFDPIPEPASLLTFGTGAAFLARSLRRRQKKAKKA